ncbi:MAG: dihydroorotase [Saprospiraceae bacterium]
MKYLLKNVVITDPQSKWNGKKRDILIGSGRIEVISEQITPPKNCQVLEMKGSSISPGWVDIGCYGGEPGMEERESLQSVSMAALAGGYTRLACMPNTQPSVHSRSEVHFLISASQSLGIHLHPIGAVSKNNASLEMAEILQMHEAGAIAFSDGTAGVHKSGLLRRVLEYIQLIPGAILIQHSHDDDLSPKSQVHESKDTAALGLKADPSVAEFSAVQRDISILEYTGSSMLINKISAAESLSTIRKAKKNNPKLFCSVSIFHLAFKDQDLTTFDSSLKLIPPLRSHQDQKSLWQGLSDGTVDLVVSDHSPVNPELKDLEFQNAAFGAISLQTSYSLFNTSSPGGNLTSLWVDKVSVMPRKIFGLPAASVEEGQEAELTWFHESLQWHYTQNNNQSRSVNSPLIGKQLTGAVLGVFNKGRFFDNKSLLL